MICKRHASHHVSGFGNALSGAFPELYSGRACVLPDIFDRLQALFSSRYGDYSPYPYTKPYVRY